MNIEVTPGRIAAARDWVMDCEWKDGDQVADYPDNAIVDGVNRHYAGGWPQFRRGRG